jgi:hypothetical protein
MIVRRVIGAVGGMVSDPGRAHDRGSGVLGEETVEFGLIGGR